jgi:hypothetical protein
MHRNRQGMMPFAGGCLPLQWTRIHTRNSLGMAVCER